MNKLKKNICKKSDKISSQTLGKILGSLVCGMKKKKLDMKKISSANMMTLENKKNQIRGTTRSLPLPNQREFFLPCKVVNELFVHTQCLLNHSCLQSSLKSTKTFI